MSIPQFDDITHVIQLSIAPVFLLTAIAGFVNALLGRLARAIDRRRTLDELLPAYQEETDTRGHMEYELELLARRIKLIMWALGLAVLSALLICMLIGVAFISAYFEARLAGAAVAILFTGSILALTACLLIFFREVMLAGTAVQHNIRTKRGA
jgi:hypothetical protein